jgi:hypothetical protein
MYTDPECFSKQVNSQAALAKDAGLPFLLTEYTTTSERSSCSELWID